MYCRAKSIQGGLLVETFSGVRRNNKFSPLCKHGGGTDVYHIVEIRNLNLYPVDIVCTGSIKANPKKLQFDSPLNSDTADTWQSTASIGQKHTFSHVKLISLQANNGSGYETVHTKVDADWPMWGSNQAIQLSITVEV